MEELKIKTFSKCTCADIEGNFNFRHLSVHPPNIKAHGKQSPSTKVNIARAHGMNDVGVSPALERYLLRNILSVSC